MPDKIKVFIGERLRLINTPQAIDLDPLHVYEQPARHDGKRGVTEIVHVIDGADYADEAFDRGFDLGEIVGPLNLLAELRVILCSGNVEKSSCQGIHGGPVVEKPWFTRVYCAVSVRIDMGHA